MSCNTTKTAARVYVTIKLTHMCVGERERNFPVPNDTERSLPLIYIHTAYTHNLLLLLLKFGALTISVNCLTLTSFCNGVGKDGSPWSCVVLHPDWMSIFKVENLKSTFKVEKSKSSV